MVVESESLELMKGNIEWDDSSNVNIIKKGTLTCFAKFFKKGIIPQQNYEKRDHFKRYLRI